MLALATGTPKYDEMASAKGLLEFPPIIIILFSVNDGLI
jgi:hypothetical protein